MVGTSLGIVFISYIFLTLSQISEKFEFLKYLSIFTLARAIYRFMSTLKKLYYITIILYFICDKRI